MNNRFNYSQHISKIRFTGLVIFIIVLSSFFGPKAVIEWDFKEHNFGAIDKNVPVKIAFKFKNPGMIPLIIEDVKPSCGCTVPVYSKEPIPGGGEGEVTVIFDAKDTGYFSKTIKVMTNTEDGFSLLYIKGEVK
jgi:hypothetical protein